MVSFATMRQKNWEKMAYLAK